jgi:uncharacterized membrane protein
MLLMGILFALGPDQLHLPPIAFLRKNHVYVMSSIGAGLILIFGFISGINRFKIYGLVFFAAVVATYFFEIRGDLNMLVIGGLILIIGLMMMVSFIHHNPFQQEEEDDAS